MIIKSLGYGKHKVSVMMWNRLTNLPKKRRPWCDKYPFYKQLEM